MDQKEMNMDVEKVQDEIVQNEIFLNGGGVNYHEHVHHHQSHHYSGEHSHHHSSHRHRSHHHRSLFRKIKRLFRRIGKSQKWQDIFLGVSVCLFVGTIIAIKYVESKSNKDVEQLQAQYQEQYQEQYEKNKAIRSAIEEYIPGIVCRGDSLTYSGYPEVLKQLINERIFAESDNSITNENITVSNEGVWGETSAEIAARCGAIPYVVSESIYIPQEVMEIPLKIGVLGSTNNNENVKFTNGVSYPVELDGLKGYLKPASNQVDGNFHVFVRKEEGEAVSVKKGTVIHIVTNQKDYSNQIAVIFMGENGGWDDDPNLLVDQINAIIEHIDNPYKRYIVVCLHTGTAESRKELETVMAMEYGDNYINLRNYICTQGYEDLGIVPTEDEMEARKQGIVPSTLLVDGLHYGGVAKKMVATAVFNRMNELGYFDEVCEAIENSK